MPDKTFASGGPVEGRRGDDQVPLLVTCGFVLTAREVDALRDHEAIKRLRVRLRGEVDDA